MYENDDISLVFIWIGFEGHILPWMGDGTVHALIHFLDVFNVQEYWRISADRLAVFLDCDDELAFAADAGTLEQEIFVRGVFGEVREVICGKGQRPIDCDAADGCFVILVSLERSRGGVG